MVATSVVPTLPAVEAALDRALQLVAECHVSGGLITLEGPPTVGKSTVMQRLADGLRADRTVVHLRVPMEAQGAVQSAGFYPADDAGPVMLVTAAAQLRDASERVLGDVQQLDKRWEVKLNSVCDAIRASRAVVLIDDLPPAVGDDAFESIFVLRAHAAVDALLAIEGTTRIVSPAGRSSVAGARRVRVGRASAADVILDASRWNGLAASARSLQEAAAVAPLADYSPLELRLAVALVHAGESPEEVVTLHPRTRELIGKLFDRLGQDGPTLRKVVGTLALARIPFTPDLLSRVGADTLDASAKLVLTSALLFQEGTQLAMHEALAHEAALRAWLTSDELRYGHRILAEYHRHEFEQANVAAIVEAALRHEMEIVHHLTEARESEALARARIYFVEQLDAFGKKLSIDARYGAAVSCYERALGHDGEDWYAHHYLAYNLDVQGINADRVEEEYRKALDLMPRHVWHHARLISFYVTRGRLEHARSAWRRARAAFGFDSAATNGRLYTELHRPLARLLLHRGLLEFAREVLDDVPPALGASLDWYAALARLREHLQEAAEDRTVFPPHIPVPERWNGPHLVQRSVRRWMPGRVASIDDSSVHIRVARRDREGNVTFGWLDLRRREFDRQCVYPAKRFGLASGTFIEIVLLPGEERRIFVHPRSPVDPDLVKVFPAPDRYLRSATPSD